MNRIEKMKKVLARRLSSITLVAEATYMRHNLSAMFRTAEAFGLQNVHFITDHSLSTSSASRGSERWLDIFVHDNSERCLKGLREKGFSLYVAGFDEGAYTPENLPVDGSVALIMGTELSGVSDTARNLSDGTVMIPMSGFTQSFNVSVATACLLYRITERRRDIVGKGDLSSQEQKEILQKWIERENKIIN
ncbi:MAG: hypothetical protein CMK59_11765 [Proteobacteria bacterium]|nr:hypothetical protein [Pseudomonadota bacterium]